MKRRLRNQGGVREGVVIKIEADDDGEAQAMSIGGIELRESGGVFHRIRERTRENLPDTQS